MDCVDLQYVSIFEGDHGGGLAKTMQCTDGGLLPGDEAGMTLTLWKRMKLSSSEASMPRKMVVSSLLIYTVIFAAETGSLN